MDGAKVTQVCTDYRADIDYRWRNHCTYSDGPAYMPLVAARLPDIAGMLDARTLNKHEILKHLAFIAEETPKLYAAGKIEKAMRWLGWLQGVYWALGYEPLDVAKKRNMPDDEK